MELGNTEKMLRKRLIPYCPCTCCKHYNNYVPTVLYYFFRLFFHAYCPGCYGCLYSVFAHEDNINEEKKKKEEGHAPNKKNWFVKLGDFVTIILFTYILYLIYIGDIRFGPPPSHT